MRHCLGHTAGLPGWEPRLESMDDLYDWDKCTGVLAKQAPWWEPGTASGYHAVTQGYLVGEVVRRITGQTVGTTCCASRSPSRWARSSTSGSGPSSTHASASRSRPTSPNSRRKPRPAASRCASTTIRRCRASAGARSPGCARKFPPATASPTPAASPHLDPARLRRRGEQQTAHGAGGPPCLLPTVRRTRPRHHKPVRWGLGYALSLFGMNFDGRKVCFWGGSGGSRDRGRCPKRRMTLAYVMNKLEGSPFGDRRNASILSAAYAALKGQ